MRLRKTWFITPYVRWKNYSQGETIIEKIKGVAEQNSVAGHVCVNSNEQKDSRRKAKREETIWRNHM